MNNHSWSLGESISTEHYAEVLDLFHELHKLYVQHGNFDEGYQTAHEYMDGIFKKILYQVEGSIHEHSHLTHERFPDIFQNRIEDVDNAIQLLKEGGSEKQVMDHYRTFSEAVKGLRILQDQFSASTNQLSSTVAWLQDYSSKMKSAEDQGVFAKLWKTLSVFTPEIKDPGI